MPQATVYNKEGNAVGVMDLSPDVFGVSPKSSVVHQVYVALMANARRPWADTKDRGEVSGGGKKPWKQKGTGRARHGSIRSPIWKGGGVTFGPLADRSYEQKINKKMNQAAVRMCLSDKANEQKIMVMEELPSDGKTKTMAGLVGHLPSAGKSLVFLLDAHLPHEERALRNIPRVAFVRAQDASVVDLMQNQHVALTKGAVAILEKRLSPKLK